jgi:hypothetical protein
LALVIGAFSVAGAPAARAETWRTLPPFELSAYRFVTESADATGTFLNPAGLAGGQGTNLYLDATGDGDQIVEGTAALQGGAWSFAYRHRDLVPEEPALGLPLAGDRNADTYVLAGGFGPPKLRLGLSRAWTRVDVPGDDAGTWNAGLLSRTGDRILLGATVENIQHPRFLDGRLRPRYSYAIGVDLLGDAPGRATLTVQGSHEDGSSDRMDLAAGLRVRFPSGLDVSMTVRDRFDRDLEFGGSITHPFGPGTISGRARQVSETETLRGQVAVQLFDPFWKRAQQQPANPRGPVRPRTPRP